MAQATKESVGPKAIRKADRVRFTMYLEEIKRSDARRKVLERQGKALLAGSPLAEYILSLSGMGATPGSFRTGPLVGLLPF